MDRQSPSWRHRVLVACSYLNIFFIIPLIFVKEEDSFGAYHVYHGFMLFVVTVAINILILVADILAQGHVATYLTPVFNILVVLWSAYGILIAFWGRMSRMWPITNILERTKL